MKLIGAGALLLASFTSLSAQAPTIESRKINLVLQKTTFTVAVEVIAAASGVEIAIDKSVPVEVLNSPIDFIRLADTELESVLQFLTKRSELTFTVLTPTSVRIQAKEP